MATRAILIMGMVSPEIAGPGNPKHF
ncbi:hypothetical protein AGR6A_Cc80181 [Agrobacterium sp. NCPPB 925]|nr:hypothetical protein AGR6A_Cc80181 [Agrobacterium sp. NCPPB 925]